MDLEKLGSGKNRWDTDIKSRSASAHIYSPTPPLVETIPTVDPKRSHRLQRNCRGYVQSHWTELTERQLLPIKGSAQIFAVKDSAGYEEIRADVNLR